MASPAIAVAGCAGPVMCSGPATANQAAYPTPSAITTAAQPTIARRRRRSNGTCFQSA